MASIFSKIAAGEIPSYKCAESDKFYTYLMLRQMRKRDKSPHFYEISSKIFGDSEIKSYLCKQI